MKTIRKIVLAGLVIAVYGFSLAGYLHSSKPRPDTLNHSEPDTYNRCQVAGLYISTHTVSQILRF